MALLGRKCSEIYRRITSRITREPDPPRLRFGMDSERLLSALNRQIYDETNKGGNSVWTSRVNSTFLYSDKPKEERSILLRA